MMPKIKESGTGGSPPKGYEWYVFPEEMDDKSEKKLLWEFLQELTNKQIELEKKVDEYKKKMDKYRAEMDKYRDEYRNELGRQTSKNIETVGLFSAILALLIIDVNIIKSAESFLAAILLVVALTCSMAIFIVLIHSFFTPEGEEKFRKKAFQIPMIILMGLVLLGVIVHFKNLDLHYSKNENQKTTIEAQNNLTTLSEKDSKTNLE